MVLILAYSSKELPQYWVKVAIRPQSRKLPVKETALTGLEDVAVEFSTGDVSFVRESGREILHIQRGAVYKA